MKEHLFNKVLRNVCEHSGLTVEEIFKTTKVSDVVFARQTLIYICVKRHMPMVMIKKYMDNNGANFPRSSLDYAYKTMEYLSKTDPDYKVILEKLSIID